MEVSVRTQDESDRTVAVAAEGIVNDAKAVNGRQRSGGRDFKILKTVPPSADPPPQVVP